MVGLVLSHAWLGMNICHSQIIFKKLTVHHKANKFHHMLDTLKLVVWEADTYQAS